MCRAFRLAVLFLLLIPSPLAANLAYAQPVKTPIAEVVDSTEIHIEKGGYRHLAANFLFPSRLGDMPARNLIAYGPGDMSIDYTLYGGGNGDSWMSLFVYPAIGSLEEDAQDVARAIVERNEAEAIDAPPNFPVPGKGAASGWYRIKLNGAFYYSGFQLAHYGDWAVKLRISVPQDATPEVLARAASALAVQPTCWH